MPQGPLTTPSNVKLLLGEAFDSETGDDGDLEYLIEAASDMFREVTGRRFSTRETGVTREFVVGKPDSLYVDELMAAADVSLVVGPWGTVASGDYRVVPEGYPTRGSYLYLESPSWPEWEDYPQEHLNWFTTNLHGLGTSKSIYDFRGRALSLTGNFGYEETPRVVENLCARTVASWYRADVGGGGRGSDRGQAFQQAPKDAIPNVILASLRRWKVPVAI